jgi:hypothetical protein
MYNSNMAEQIKNLFDIEEAEYLKKLIDDEKAKRTVFVWDEFGGDQFPQEMMDSAEHMVQNVSLGKIMFNLSIPDSLKDKLVGVAKYMGYDVEYFCATYTEYSRDYGSPVLTPHKDKQNFCLIDYQLDANTSWPLFVEEQIFDLSNNDGLIFLPSQMVHGRPEKVFLDKEFVKMIFFDMKLVNE